MLLGFSRPLGQFSCLAVMLSRQIQPSDDLPGPSRRRLKQAFKIAICICDEDFFA